MATVVPPPSKRQRREDVARTSTQADLSTILPPDNGSFKARFIDASNGAPLADAIEIPLADATEKNVSLLLNTLLGRDRDDFLPYRFRIHIPGKDIVVDQYPADLLALLRSHGVANPFETTVTLAAEPQAVFKVQSVTRLAAKIPGHGEAILCAQFSPASSAMLATGSGDKTARIWDTNTGTPKYTLKGHTGWVLGVSWAPDGSRLATCSMDGTVRVWDPATGKQINGGTETSGTFRGHAKPSLQLAWEPFHLWRDGTPRLASCSKDATVRVWVVNTGRTEHVLSGHKGSVTCVKWGAGGGSSSSGGASAGSGLIYTGSHDKTVRVWDPVKGTLVHELKAHAHWVNHLALSTDFVLKTGFFDHTRDIPATEEGKRAKAKERFEKAATQDGKVVERLVSASDDFTMFLWDPMNTTAGGGGKKPLARMLGHQKQVNHVCFSPDGAVIASCGFDNHTKLWSGRDGKFINTLRGHVAHVYQAAFSADSRLLVTCSRDNTLKVWNVRACKLAEDLPGHEDEVYAVDWSADGQKVGSGGRDKAVRLWRN
ncbi:WD repeat-containing protein [Coniella lustricola]|uniref:WD repeat-containing protein n=1 Tax=Coniella lustricola TaxID=2025994 RepID=A0A2T2ZZW2_9PEZI|nr:WD repeat-containing protein [Coniella lustricola]